MNNKIQADNSVNVFDPSLHLKPLTLTAAAVVYVRKKLAERGKGMGLRLGVKKAGCSGLEYVVDYVDVQAENDVVFAVEKDLAVFVDKECLLYLNGTEIDYVQKGIMGGELKFNNPNAKVSCGCGESFNIKN